MPVTAKLSKLFYERLGEEVANELVDWFNAVDATYRADLRELNELNFTRFDARLEQRLAEFDAKWRVRWDRLDAKIDQRVTELRGEFGRLEGSLNARLAAQRAALIRWMFGFWIATLLPLAGLVTTLAVIFRRAG